MADFPSHPDAIEPAWLGERLRAAGVVRDAEITALSWVPIGTGQVGDSARLTLTYDRPGAGPATVAGKFPAADQTDDRYLVMRCTKRSLLQQRLPAKQPSCRINCRRGQGFLLGHRWQDADQPTRQHALSRPRWPDHQQVVSTRCRNRESTLGLLVAANITQVAADIGRLLGKRSLGQLRQAGTTLQRLDDLFEMAGGPDTQAGDG